MLKSELEAKLKELQMELDIKEMKILELKKELASLQNNPFYEAYKFCANLKIIPFIKEKLNVERI